MVKLLKHLPARGWDVHVVAPRARSGWFGDPDLLNELSTIEITRVGLGFGRTRSLEQLRQRAKDPASTGLGTQLLRGLVRVGRGTRNALAVPDEHIGFSTAAALAAQRIVGRQRVDAVMTASFPYSCHLAGLYLKTRTGLPWLADFADPWAGHHFRNQDRGLRTLTDTFLEERVFFTADTISLASPGMERLVRERYQHPITRKISLIANSYDAEEFTGERPVSSTNIFELLFLGTFDARLTPPTPFVSAMEILFRQHPQLRGKLRLRIRGGSDLESSTVIRDAINAGNLDDAFDIQGYISHRQAITEMKRAHALALTVAPGAHWHLTAKIFEYLASGTPIIAAVPKGDCRSLFEQCGGAAVVDPNDTRALAQLLETCARGDAVPLNSPRNAEAIAELCAPKVADHAVNILNRLIKP